MGNCRKGFMSRCGWIIVGVRRNVGTAGPARFMPPTHRKRQRYINIQYVNCFDDLDYYRQNIFLVIYFEKSLK